VDPVVEMMAQVWASIDRLCHGFSHQDWARPTDCPGWSVKDQLSHLVAPEAALAGLAQPEHPAPPFPHVRNPLGQLNEDAVDLRRPRSGPEVLGEFREVTARRLASLEAMGEQELAAESWTPLGPGTYRDLLAVRVFDAWVHEQDMRGATGRPGHLEGPVARHSLQRCLAAMPWVVGKAAGAPEGSSVLFEVSGPTAARLAVVVEDGRARAVEDLDAAPMARLEADFECFTRVCCGRWDPDRAVSSGRLVTGGDLRLAGDVARHLAFMP
jgi:uncharacterized protein (TIGR03083 family)